MEKINYDFYLEKYLDDELSASERKWMEKEMDGNEKLQAEFELRKDLNRMLEDTDALQLSSKLEDVYKDYAHEVSYKPFLSGKLKRTIVAAGSVAASLLLVFMVYVNNFQPLDKHELYAKYFEPYEATVYRSASENTDKVLREAMQHYESKDYSQAIIWFERVLEKDSLNVPTNFYSGISYMEVKEYNQANKSFNVVIDQENSLFFEQAEWYLGFCYLMTDQKDKAKKQFNAIAASDSYYNKEASQVLRRIK